MARRSLEFIRIFPRTLISNNQDFVTEPVSFRELAPFFLLENCHPFDAVTHSPVTPVTPNLPGFLRMGALGRANR